MDELPPSFRAVFMLRAVEQMSITETASCLGIPGETVKTRFHRANKLLRQVLTAQFGAIFDDVYPFLGSRCDRVVATVLVDAVGQCCGQRGRRPQMAGGLSKADLRDRCLPAV